MSGDDHGHASEACDAVSRATEGLGRVGTASWPECCRDTYSLAIEEVFAAILKSPDPAVHAAMLDALVRRGALPDQWRVLRPLEVSS